MADDRARSGRLKSLRAEATIKVVRELIHRNTFGKQKVIRHMIS